MNTCEVLSKHVAQHLRNCAATKLLHVVAHSAAPGASPIGWNGLEPLSPWLIILKRIPVIGSIQIRFMGDHSANRCLVFIEEKCCHQVNLLGIPSTTSLVTWSHQDNRPHIKILSRQEQIWCSPLKTKFFFVVNLNEPNSIDLLQNWSHRIIVDVIHGMNKKRERTS